ncbi:MAG: Smr/MutS family protein [Candidatus Margulisbacteria bacterium]|jgi:DNA-nicking Smr family endonuclease|nr:Smr/MutS family protein [Candidatus Margulisiibacteriota bacterium]
MLSFFYLFCYYSAVIQLIDVHTCTIDRASELILSKIHSCKKTGVKVLKIIHGHHRGTAIKDFLPDLLLGSVKAFCPGEKFNMWEAEGRALIALCPALAKDHDYRFANPGVTVAVL